jgi:hypothetical protein
MKLYGRIAREDVKGDISNSFEDTVGVVLGADCWDSTISEKGHILGVNAHGITSNFERISRTLSAEKINNEKGINMSEMFVELFRLFITHMCMVISS